LDKLQISASAETFSNKTTGSSKGTAKIQMQTRASMPDR
jgi:hypothetical protein